MYSENNADSTILGNMFVRVHYTAYLMWGPKTQPTTIVICANSKPTTNLNNNTYYLNN